MEMAGSGDRPDEIVHLVGRVDTHAEILEVRPTLDKHTGWVRLSVVVNGATVQTVWMGSECRCAWKPFFVQAVVGIGPVGFVPRLVRLPGVPRTWIDESIGVGLRVRRVLELRGGLVHQGGGSVMD